MTRHRDRSLIKISLMLRKEDVRRAAQIASRKGIGYQTYIRQVLQTALDREIASTGKVLVD